ncbi:MAG: ABC transporter ATP-binding protein [Lachnospiraceae bacterium]|nr:ABC transporter ATP-binding protein [Lachnospiraceae bacterium]
MKLIINLIRQHKFIFFSALFFTFLTALINLYWNNLLADMINSLESIAVESLTSFLIQAVIIILFHTLTELLSSCLASYTCEVFAHEMRMGYARFYLRSDIQTLTKLNAGEAQSAMQNELSEISVYLNENLFSLAKQFVAFGVTVIFLLCQNVKLTLVSTLPVVPLIIYCYFSSQVIKNYTEQCQISKQQINGLTDTLLALFPVIQVYNAKSLISNTMNERLLEWQSSNIRKERIAAKLMSLSGVLSFIPLLLLLGFGGLMVINGELSIGIFYIFINLSGNVSGFLQNMPNIYAGFRRFSASVNRLEKKLVLKERREYVSIHSLFR